MLRVLLILLALALPLPAIAVPACHGSAAVNHREHHAPRERTPVAVPHVCFGCAEVNAWRCAPVAAPILPPALPPAPRVARIDRGETAPPAVPPPRSA